MSRARVTPFQPEGWALEIFQSRHAASPTETWDEACLRVARTVATAENGHAAEWTERFAEALRCNLLMPGGRIWYGAGRLRGQLLNCFVIPTEDSREGWGQTLYDSVVISGTGGGVGLNCSPVRPKGSAIKGTGGTATGAVSLMQAVDAVGDVIKAGGGRRTALMLCLSLSHGDIAEFLDKKLDLGQLNNANVSVVFDEDPERFFELVRAKADFPLTFRGKQVGSIPAHDLWMRIVRNALRGGEPGLLNGYLANRMSNIWYLEQLTSTNPCITGDTLIATADGRNAVSIRQLAEEGRDVPVYSMHPGTHEVEIKMGLNPRVTGRKSEVWKLTLDDGSVVRATPDHKFMLRDGTYHELRDLKPGDSLMPFNSRKESIYRNIDGVSGNGKPCGNRAGRQYRLIHEFHNGPQKPGTHIHHRDFNSLNDNIENLLEMDADEHMRLHAERMMGEKNPYHRMPDEWKENFARHVGPDNGMFGRENRWGYHTDEAKAAISAAHLGREASTEAREKMSAARTAYYDRKYEREGLPRTVTKACPNPDCGRKFEVPWTGREQTYCSKPCFLAIYNRRADVNAARSDGWREKGDGKREEWLKLYTARRFELGRDLQKREWEGYLKSKGMSWRFSNATFKSLGELKEAANGYNHRVASVVFDCHEDVYNITVEDNHNFGIITSWDDEKFVQSSGLFTRNCGEIWMSPYDCCCLGALVLPRFVTEDERDLDWELLAATIKTSVRFLDDVLTVNNYPLPEIQAQCNRLRRVGLGVTGLHHMLLTLGHKYNSPKGLEFVDKLMKFIKNASYEASCDLAVEKGSFPAFDPVKFLKSNFVKTLKPTIRERIRRDGVRNCALNTIAPTGTISIVCGVSSGIEPIFAPGYERRYRKGEEHAVERVVDPLFKRFVAEGRSVKHFQGAHDLGVRDHFEMQMTCQAHIDNAVSKTINLPHGTSPDDLSELYMEYLPVLKGVTVYPDGSRENQPLTPIPLEDAEQAAFDEVLAATAGNDGCRSGVCDV